MDARSDISEGWPKAVLFDLDGTLIESAADLAGSVNLLLARDDLGPLDLAAVRDMIGDGVRALVERAYAACRAPLTGPALETRHAAMMSIYGRNLTRLTTLMPGAAEAVAACRRHEAQLAVITNKPEAFSRKILANFGLLPSIGLVVGGDTGPARKPALDMLLHALLQFGVEPRHAVMVGDGPADFEAARAAGVPSIAVAGGYTRVPAGALGASTVIASLADLPSGIAALRNIPA